MATNNFIPPYLRNKLDTFKDYGIPKCIPCLLVTAFECLIITGVLWALIKLIHWRRYLGITVIAVLCFFILLGWSLISWKKAKNKRDDYIKEKG